MRTKGDIVTIILCFILAIMCLSEAFFPGELKAFLAEWFRIFWGNA